MFYSALGGLAVVLLKFNIMTKEEIIKALEQISEEPTQKDVVIYCSEKNYEKLNEIFGTKPKEKS